MVHLHRRRLLVGSLGVVGVVLLGGCDADEPDAPASTGGREDILDAGDVDMLAAVAQLERAVAESYRSIVSARPDEIAAAGLAERAALHLAHHDEHARSLDLLTGPVESVPTLPGLVVPSADEVAELPVGQLAAGLRRLEDVLAQTYLDAVSRLSTADLRQVAAGLGAAEAGHAVALDLLLGGGIAAYDPTSMPAGLYPVDRSAFQG